MNSIGWVPFQKFGQAALRSIRFFTLTFHRIFTFWSLPTYILVFKKTDFVNEHDKKNFLIKSSFCTENYALYKWLLEDIQYRIDYLHVKMKSITDIF